MLIKYINLHLRIVPNSKYSTSVYIKKKHLSLKFSHLHRQLPNFVKKSPTFAIFSINIKKTTGERHLLQNF